ncbi:MAG: hypothetical protein ACRDGL_11510 [Candidatus Limnocylindrales bacterium]
MTVSDEELRAMLQARAARADARGLRETTLKAARSEPQVHPLRGIRTSLAHGRINPSGAPSILRPRRSGPALLTAAVVVVAIVLVALASGALGPGLSGHGGGVGAAEATSTATRSPFAGLPSPTNVLLTPPPYAPGTCPVTPTTDRFGGTAPEVVVSGVVWRGVSEGWLAGRFQKLGVFQLAVSDGDRTALRATTFIAATQLPLADEPGGAPLSLRYAPIGNPAVYGVTLPAAGCWLLTLIGPDVASSIVVQAGPEPSAPPPAGSDQQIPTETLPLERPTTCPSSPSTPDLGGGPPERAIDSIDPGGVTWYTHPAVWLIGQPDKLVLHGRIGAPAPFERIVATPMGTVSRPPAFVTRRSIIVTPVPGSGDISAGITLPEAGCWAFTYVDPTVTSTVVVPVAAGP